METNRRSPFGISLRQYREAAGLSQEQLAERTGLSQRGISDLERGVRNTPRPETVRMLADGLGLSEEQRTNFLAARNSPGYSRPAHSPHAPPDLPTPSNPFIGRLQDIDAIAGILTNDGARLLTLTGPGGVGKTRIAIEAAHRLAERYSDGAVFVDLSSIRRPEMVVAAIADRLRVLGQGEIELRQVLAVALQDRPILLVLDNFEQVVNAATDIAWLLSSCQDLTLIVTSRVPLHIAAEHVMPIEPMTLPADDNVTSLAQSEAVSLFVARAHAVDHRFALNEENASAVAALVTRLQGMPLAIELAATRVRLWSIPDLLLRLESQLPVLSGGARDIPARHRTMRDTIAWSYDLMSPSEQVVFRTLAIFPEGCTLASAVAILEVDSRFSEADAINAVELLVDSSILRRRVGSDGRMRYRMLQPVREFGLEQLVIAGEDSIARRAAHDAWCLPLARNTESGIAQPQALDRLNQTSAEYQNLREHINWLIQQDLAEEALYVSGAIAPYRTLRGHFDECRRELEMLLDHPKNRALTLARVRAQVWLGIICLNQADTEHALLALQPAVALARQLNVPRCLELALLALGVTMMLTGDLDTSDALLSEGISVAESIGETVGISRGARYRGLILDRRGEPDRAYELIEEALAVGIAAGDQWDVALCKLELGDLNIRREELDQAESLILEAQRLLIELDDRRDLPTAYIKLADIARLRGDLEGAEHKLEHSLAMARDFGSMLDMAHSYLGMALIARLKGDFVSSQSLTCSAIRWYERCGNTVDAVRCLDNLADIAIASGEFARAAWCIGAVDAVLSDRGMTRSELAPDEHHARVASVISTLGEEEWQLHHGQGRSMRSQAILAEVKSWLSCRISDVWSISASGQTTQTRYDNGTR